MKTALESLDALEALARKVAEGKTDIVALRHEAMYLVAELPEPVDEFEAAAKRYYDEWLHDGTTQPFAQDAMAYALRRAREEGVK